MADRRLKDRNWTVGDEKGYATSWDQVKIAVLMDIRDELKAIRVAVENTDRTLRCPNFLEIPRVLHEIRKNTRKLKKKKPLKLVRSA